jgi:hypothetical protein
MSTMTATAIEGALLLARLQARLAITGRAEPSRSERIDANWLGVTLRRILLNIASLSGVSADALVSPTCRCQIFEEGIYLKNVKSAGTH